MRHVTNKLNSQGRSCFRFFSILPELHTRHICTRFELWGRPFRSSICFLPSFLHPVLLWKEFNPHSFIVTFHFSCSFGLPPAFYPAEDSCWIYVNVCCSVCIYSMLLVVSLNNKPQLAHRRQQSVGSAFNFITIFLLSVGLKICRLYLI